MAGTLFGLPMSQQVDELGNPLSGGLLYIYEAGTSTPASTYSDFSLSTVQTFPLQLSASGRVPAFYVSDGSYRARLTTSGGVEIFDEASITSIGASSGGSGAVDSVISSGDTGDMQWLPISGTKSGWVRCNGRTIGSGSSAATERANADTQALFEFLWNNISDTFAAVSGGRGASAEADFNANKTIVVIDMRGYTAVGLDDMGNSAASRIAGGTPTTVATTGGAETVTLAEANLPSHTHGPGTLGGTTGSGGSHTHDYTRYNQRDARQGGGTGDYWDGSSTQNTSSDGAHTHSFTATTGVTAATGSGTAVNKMQPYRLGTWYIRL